MIKKTLIIVTMLLSAFLGFAEDSGQTIKISWWTLEGGEEEKLLHAAIANEYMEAHPNVTIDIYIRENATFKKELYSAMMAGNPPDIFHSWGGPVLAEYARAGLLRDITKEVEVTDWGGSMAAGVWSPYRVDGRIYAAPFDMGAIAFWYNKDLLEKAGFNDFPATYSALLVLVKRLRMNGIAPIALGGKDKWPALYLWNYLALRLGGGDLIAAALDGSNPKGFADPAFVEASRMMAELAKEGAFQEGFLGATYIDEAGLVGNGKAAMELMGQWAPNVERDASDSKKGLGNRLAAAPFPAVKDGKGSRAGTVGGGNAYAFGKDAPDAAVDFMRYLDRKDNLVRIGKELGYLVPARGAKDFMVDRNMKAVMGIVEGSDYCQLYLDTLIPPQTANSVMDAIYALLAGTATPEQACAEIQAAYQANHW